MYIYIYIYIYVLRKTQTFVCEHLIYFVLSPVGALSPSTAPLSQASTPGRSVRLRPPRPRVIHAHSFCFIRSSEEARSLKVYTRRSCGPGICVCGMAKTRRVKGRDGGLAFNCLGWGEVNEEGKKKLKNKIK